MIDFFFFRQLYSTSVFDRDEVWMAANMRRILEPLLVQYKVDVAIWGHMVC